MRRAVAHVNETIGPKLKGATAADQTASLFSAAAEVAERADFLDFWRAQVDEAHGRPLNASFVPHASGLRHADVFDVEFAEMGGEGPTPYEVLLHAALVGDTSRFTRQDGVEQTWRIMQPLLDAPPPVHTYAPVTWGPSEAADKLLANPVIESYRIEVE